MELPNVAAGDSPVVRCHILHIDRPPHKDLNRPLVQTILSLTARMVQMAGLETLLANNAEEAIQIYKEKSEDISLVMTDYNMPGLNGDELILALLALNPNLKTVLISGFDQSTYVAEGGTLFENMQFLAKPFNRASLNEILEKI